MESFITGQIFKAANEGDYIKLMAYVLIFCFLWLEIRQLKASLKNINHNVVKSHAIIRREQKQVVVRVEKLEAHAPNDKGVFARQNFKSPKGGVQT